MTGLEHAISQLGVQSSSEPAVSSLGTAADIWVIIALLMPGFITFKIISWLAIYETKIDQFTATVYSLMLSLVIFLPVSLLFNLKSFNEIRTNVGYPAFIFSLLGFAVLFGFIPGLVLRWTKRGKYTFEGPWDTFGDEMSGKYVIVRTIDGREYRGWLKKVSQGVNKKEISLGEPKFIEYDENGNPKEICLGTELLISEPNIHSILR